MDEVIAAMVEQARAAGHTRAHQAFESYRWAFGVKWGETKPVIRPPDTQTSEPVAPVTRPATAEPIV